MLDLFERHIDSRLPELRKKHLLLGVSGGLDSMVLLDLMWKINKNIVIAHCNFQLRGEESDGDNLMVENVAGTMGIPFVSQRFDTLQFAKDYKISIQLAARKLRYDWFYTVLNDRGLDYILTAHHLDDQLETFLINLVRGTGLDGLLGIPERNGEVLRPLLPFSRSDIEQYAKANNLAWREDSSNLSDKYQRNKIRHHIVPVLKELNSGFNSSFSETLRHLGQSKSMADDASRIVYRKVVKETDQEKRIDLEELGQLPNYEAYLYYWLSPLGFTAWKDIVDIVAAQSGKKIFSQDFILLKDRKELIVKKKQGQDYRVYFIEQIEQNLKEPIKITFKIVKKQDYTKAKCIFVDFDRLRFPLVLRKWQKGDYFYPFGMKGKKKVSKFFKDEKMSAFEKQETWMLCSEEDIMWIVGKRMDDRFKVNNQTKTILEITLEE